MLEYKNTSLCVEIQKHTTVCWKTKTHHCVLEHKNTSFVYWNTLTHYWGLEHINTSCVCWNAKTHYCVLEHINTSCVYRNTLTFEEIHHKSCSLDANAATRRELDARHHDRPKRWDNWDIPRDTRDIPRGRQDVHRDRRAIHEAGGPLQLSSNQRNMKISRQTAASDRQHCDVTVLDRSLSI